jgi:hypothetical protein
MSNMMKTKAATNRRFAVIFKVVDIVTGEVLRDVKKKDCLLNSPFSTSFCGAIPNLS